ncbi:MAG: hypothetical protein ACTHQQ_11930 [Solirubrobacteraceae bacterium]
MNSVLAETLAERGDWCRGGRAHARSVTMVVRADLLEASRLVESVTIVDRAGQQRELPADAMYVLVGGQPLTAGVEG